VPAVEVKAGMRVRGGDGGWKEVEDATASRAGYNTFGSMVTTFITLTLAIAG